MPDWYPIKLTAHVRTYAFDRLIPDRLGKPGMPDGTVAETWEVSDYRETTGIITNGSFADFIVLALGVLLLALHEHRDVFLLFAYLLGRFRHSSFLRSLSFRRKPGREMLRRWYDGLHQLALGCLVETAHQCREREGAAQMPGAVDHRCGHRRYLRIAFAA